MTAGAPRAAAAAPAQAAYEAFWANRPPVIGTAMAIPADWDSEWPEVRAQWEAAAQAAIDAANVPAFLIEMKSPLSEADVTELRKRFEEAVKTRKPELLMGDPVSERVAELVAEGNELRALLNQAGDALWACAKAALTVKPSLDQPYPDDPRWTPYTRWVERPAREAHDLAMAIRKHLRNLSASPAAAAQDGTAP